MTDHYVDPAPLKQVVERLNNRVELIYEQGHTKCHDQEWIEKKFEAALDEYRLSPDQRSAARLFMNETYLMHIERETAVQNKIAALQPRIEKLCAWTAASVGAGATALGWRYLVHEDTAWMGALTGGALAFMNEKVSAPLTRYIRKREYDDEFNRFGKKFEKLKERTLDSLLREAFK